MGKGILKRCLICGKLFAELPHNAEPIRQGKCCVMCYYEVVKPYREKRQNKPN